jgi:hypothetical protein
MDEAKTADLKWYDEKTLVAKSLIEDEIQSDLEAYSKSGQDFNKFFELMQGRVQRENRHHSQVAEAASKRFEPSNSFFFIEFLMLKRESLWEAYSQLLDENLSLKLKEALANPGDKPRYAAAVFHRWQAWRHFIQPRGNMQKIYEDTKFFFMGYKTEIINRSLNEVHEWVDEWVRKSRIDLLIEFGQELKKLKKKLHGNTFLDRNYFCLMYWNFFVKEYHVSEATRLAPHRDIPERSFHEFLWNGDLQAKERQCGGLVRA